MHNRNFTTILFDMDGVVIDSERLHLRAMGLTLEKHSIPYNQPFLNEYVGRSDESFFSHVFHNIDSSIEIEQLLEEKNVYFEGLLAELDYIEGFTDFRESIRDIQVGLVTSSSRFSVNKVNELINHLQHFDVVVAEEDTQKHKPNPDPYLLALEMFGADGSETLVIEDSINGIIAGKKAGCVTAGLTTSFNSERLFDAGADYVFDSYSEIKEKFNL